MVMNLHVPQIAGNILVAKPSQQRALFHGNQFISAEY
jgi:hypothetical protein